MENVSQANQALTIAEIKEEIEAKKAALQENQDEINRIQAKQNTVDETISSLQNELTDVAADNLKTEIEAKKTEVEAKETKVKNKAAEVKKKAAEVKTKTAELEQLQRTQTILEQNPVKIKDLEDSLTLLNIAERYNNEYNNEKKIADERLNLLNNRDYFKNLSEFDKGTATTNTKAFLKSFLYNFNNLVNNLKNHPSKDLLSNPFFISVKKIPLTVFDDPRVIRQAVDALSREEIRKIEEELKKLAENQTHMEYLRNAFTDLPYNTRTKPRKLLEILATRFIKPKKQTARLGELIQEIRDNKFYQAISGDNSLTAEKNLVTRILEEEATKLNDSISASLSDEERGLLGEGSIAQVAEEMKSTDSHELTKKKEKLEQELQEAVDNEAKREEKLEQELQEAVDNEAKREVDTEVARENQIFNQLKAATEELAANKIYLAFASDHEKATLKTQIAELKTQKAELIEKAKRQLGTSIQAAESEIEQLNEKKSRLKEEQATLQGEIDTTNETISKITELEKEQNQFESNNTQIQKLENTNKTLEDELQDLETQLREAKKLDIKEKLKNLKDFFSEIKGDANKKENVSNIIDDETLKNYLEADNEEDPSETLVNNLLENNTGYEEILSKIEEEIAEQKDNTKLIEIAKKAPKHEGEIPSISISEGSNQYEYKLEFKRDKERKIVEAELLCKTGEGDFKKVAKNTHINRYDSGVNSILKLKGKTLEAGTPIASEVLLYEEVSTDKGVKIQYTDGAHTLQLLGDINSNDAKTLLENLGITNLYSIPGYFQEQSTNLERVKETFEEYYDEAITEEEEKAKLTKGSEKNVYGVNELTEVHTTLNQYIRGDSDKTLDNILDHIVTQNINFEKIAGKFENLIKQNSRKVFFRKLRTTLQESVNGLSSKDVVIEAVVGKLKGRFDNEQERNIRTLRTYLTSEDNNQKNEALDALADLDVNLKGSFEELQTLIEEEVKKQQNLEAKEALKQANRETLEQIKNLHCVKLEGKTEYLWHKNDPITNAVVEELKRQFDAKQGENIITYLTSESEIDNSLNTLSEVDAKLALGEVEEIYNKETKKLENKTYLESIRAALQSDEHKNNRDTAVDVVASKLHEVAKTGDVNVEDIKNYLSSNEKAPKIPEALINSNADFRSLLGDKNKLSNELKTDINKEIKRKKEAAERAENEAFLEQIKNTIKANNLIVQKKRRFASEQTLISNKTDKQPNNKRKIISVFESVNGDEVEYQYFLGGNGTKLYRKTSSEESFKEALNEEDLKRFASAINAILETKGVKTDSQIKLNDQEVAAATKIALHTNPLFFGDGLREGVVIEGSTLKPYGNSDKTNFKKNLGTLGDDVVNNTRKKALTEILKEFESSIKNLGEDYRNAVIEAAVGAMSIAENEIAKRQQVTNAINSYLNEDTDETTKRAALTTLLENDNIHFALVRDTAVNTITKQAEAQAEAERQAEAEKAEAEKAEAERQAEAEKAEAEKAEAERQAKEAQANKEALTEILEKLKTSIVNLDGNYRNAVIEAAIGAMGIAADETKNKIKANIRNYIETTIAAEVRNFELETLMDYEVDFAEVKNAVIKAITEEAEAQAEAEEQVANQQQEPEAESVVEEPVAEYVAVEDTKIEGTEVSKLARAILNASKPKIPMPSFHEENLTTDHAAKLTPEAVNGNIDTVFKNVDEYNKKIAHFISQEDDMEKFCNGELTKTAGLGIKGSFYEEEGKIDITEDPVEGSVGSKLGFKKGDTLKFNPKYYKEIITTLRSCEIDEIEKLFESKALTITDKDSENKELSFKEDIEKGIFVQKGEKRVFVKTVEEFKEVATEIQKNPRRVPAFV